MVQPVQRKNLDKHLSKFESNPIFVVVESNLN